MQQEQQPNLAEQITRMRKLLERVLTKEAMFGTTDKLLCVDIHNEIHPGWNDEEEL